LPAAFGILVLQKAYGVARASVTPRLLPAEITLVTANSRSQLITLTASMLGGAVAAGIQATAGSAWVLRAGTLIYLAAMFLALRLPDQVDTPPAVPADRHQPPPRNRSAPQSDEYFPNEQGRYARSPDEATWPPRPGRGDTLPMDTAALPPGSDGRTTGARKRRGRRPGRDGGRLACPRPGAAVHPVLHAHPGAGGDRGVRLVLQLPGRHRRRVHRGDGRRPGQAVAGLHGAARGPRGGPLLRVRRFRD